eukprot:m.49899 g.49899  ORF g.49899 m.49899 type:complete len:192 (+) comp10875_c0_seq2:419-994(+)
MLFIVECMKKFSTTYLRWLLHLLTLFFCNFLFIKVENTDVTATVGEFEDVSKVEKFELSAEEYASRQDTVRAFKEKMKMGRFNPDYEEKMAAKAQEEEELIGAMKVGDRCEVSTATGTHRGAVKYLGTTKFKDGKWVGVQLDEPFGKNNGTVKGETYFVCPEKYGVFLKPKSVRVGDYPEEDIDLSSDDEL